MPERVGHSLSNRAHDRVTGVREPVIDPEPLSARVYEARAAQVRQVSRGLRLRDPQALVNVTDAHLARQQQPQNPQPCRIGQGFEQVLELREVSHICALTNIARFF